MPPAFLWIIWALMVFGPVLIWLLFRGRGYKRHLLNRPPGPNWQRTTERSVDPTTGELMEVWFDPATGDRAYIRAPR